MGKKIQLKRVRLFPDNFGDFLDTSGFQGTSLIGRFKKRN